MQSRHPCLHTHELRCACNMIALRNLVQCSTTACTSRLCLLCTAPVLSGEQSNYCVLISPQTAGFRKDAKKSARRCCRGTIWYCAGLESRFPQGYPGSNPGDSVQNVLIFAHAAKLRCVPVYNAAKLHVQADYLL